MSLVSRPQIEGPTTGTCRKVGLALTFSSSQAWNWRNLVAQLSGRVEGLLYSLALSMPQRFAAPTLFARNARLAPDCAYIEVCSLRSNRGAQFDPSAEQAPDVPHGCRPRAAAADQPAHVPDTGFEKSGFPIR